MSTSPLYIEFAIDHREPEIDWILWVKVFAAGFLAGALVAVLSYVMFAMWMRH